MTIKLHENTDRIPIGCEAKQDDTMSPKLVISVLESAFKQLNWDQKSVNIDDKYLNNLRFADDVVLVSDGFREMEMTLNNLHELWCTALTLTPATAKTLKGTQREMEKPMLGITLRDLIRNEDLRRETGVNDVVNVVVKLKWHWTNHVVRTESRQ
ncbi:hypothetical protein Trydic_g5361 [Trypoxylus dichotomus]